MHAELDRMKMRVMIIVITIIVITMPTQQLKEQSEHFSFTGIGKVLKVYPINAAAVAN